MVNKKKDKNNTKFDIVVVGAGPAGIAFACGFANTKLKIAIIDKLQKKILSDLTIGIASYTQCDSHEYIQCVISNLI